MLKLVALYARPPLFKVHLKLGNNVFTRLLIYANIIINYFSLSALTIFESIAVHIQCQSDSIVLS